MCLNFEIVWQVIKHDVENNRTFLELVTCRTKLTDYSSKRDYKLVIHQYSRRKKNKASGKITKSGGHKVEGSHINRK